MIRLALRNLLARKRRTVLTALAVVVGVAQVTGAFILTDSMNKTIDELFEAGSSDVAVVITPAGAQSDPLNPPTIPARLVETVSKVDGVRLATGEVFATVSVLGPDGKPVSVGPPSFVASLTERGIANISLASGRYPTTDDEVAIDRISADRVGFEIGDRVSVVGEEGVEKPVIVGLARYGDDTSLGGATIVIANPATASRLSGRGTRFDDIVVDAEPGVAKEELRDRITVALQGEPVKVQTGEESAQTQAEDLKSQLGFLQPVLLAFAGIALFVGSFVIINTFSATLAQRSRELALLRALGATRRQVSRSVMAESFLIGLVAGILGLLAGLLVAPGIIAMFKGFGIDLPTQGTVVETRTIIVALLIGPVVTTFAGLFPARRAVRIPPIQAMQGDTTRQERGRPGPLAYVVAAAAAAAITGSLVTTSTTAAVLVGAGAILTLIAVAQLAPLVLEPVLRVLGAPFARLGETGRLAQLNAMRSPRRTTTTAGALMVGVALVTFVAVFAAGLSAIARDAFGDRVRAPLALSAGSSQFYPGGAQELAAQDPGVGSISGVAFGSFDKPGTETGVPVTGIEPRTLASVYRMGWADGDDALLQRMTRGQVIVDRAAEDATIAAARPGDVLRLKRAADGRVLKLTVAGVIDEGTSLLGGGILVDRRTLSADQQGGKLWLSLIAVAGGADESDVQQRLTAALEDRFPTVDALTAQELEDRFVGQVNQLVNMIYAFLAFALLVSLLGISTTFTLTVQERRRELGMMRAVGATRRQIRRLVRLEAVLTGLLGAVLGVAVGLGFGALVARLLADDGFGYVVPVGTVVMVALLAGLVAALAASLPARRAGRTDIVQAVSAD
ncbi:MAG: ABC transporter permease [Solirubrobacteraceae bacterium]|nr:ABC transporter permease [Solirubrobacteraceae bacterium]